MSRVPGNESGRVHRWLQRHRGRRGVAMMLVLCMLAGVSVLTAAALTSQQSAPDTGVNAAAEVQARWSAESAANIAVAVLETNYDFSGANAEMMKDMLVGAGLAGVTVTDLQGNPPQEDDRELMLKASSVVNGVRVEVTKQVSLGPIVPIAQAANPHYPEFALAASDTMVLEAGSGVFKWHLSPEADSPRPVALGALTSLGTKVSIDAAANTSGAVLFANKSADSTMQTRIGSTTLAAGGDALGYDLPLTAELTPAAFSTLATATTSDLDLDGAPASATLPTGGKYAKLRVRNGATLTLSAANGTHYSFGDIDIEANAEVRVMGAVVIEARGDLRVCTGGAVTLGDSAAALAVFTSGHVQVNNAGFGVPVTVARDSARSFKTVPAYQRPSRVRLFAQVPTAGFGAPTIQVHGNGLLLGCVHAPGNAVAVNHGAIIGNVVAKSVGLRANSFLVYDPALDNRAGFTNFSGPLYENRAPIADLTNALASFNVSLGAKSLTTSLLSIGTALPPMDEEGGGSGPTPAARNARVAVVVPSLVNDPLDNDDDEEDDD
ncbi:MAG: hypothetical protein J0L61_02575 [Planctomycetes bacterium]|nr:hypothetical protein [Planctomycetota bacterium]